MEAAQLAACPENARPLSAQLTLVYVLRAVPLSVDDPLVWNLPFGQHH